MICVRGQRGPKRRLYFLEMAAVEGLAMTALNAKPDRVLHERLTYKEVVKN